MIIGFTFYQVQVMLPCVSDVSNHKLAIVQVVEKCLVLFVFGFAFFLLNEL